MNSDAQNSDALGVSQGAQPTIHYSDKTEPSAAPLAGQATNATELQVSAATLGLQVNGPCGLWRGGVFHPIDPSPEALCAWLQANPAPAVKPARWENDQLLIRFCQA